MFCQSLNLPPSHVWLFIWQPSGWESESFSCRVTWRRHPERSTGYGWTSSRQAPTTTTAAGVGRRGAAAEAADQLLSPLLPLLLSLSDHLLRRGTGSISFRSYYHLLPAFRQLHKHSSEVLFICDIFGREADSFYLLSLENCSIIITLLRSMWFLCTFKSAARKALSNWEINAVL